MEALEAETMPPHDGTTLGQDDLLPMFEMELGDLTPELLEKAKQELGETAELRNQALIEFREMIHSRGDLSCRMDDEFLLRFLRARRFNVERSYKLLENYLNFKLSHPDIHENVYPLRLKFLGDDDVINVLPYKDQEGRRMIVYKIGNWAPSKFKVVELFKASVLTMELGIMEQATTITGGVCIFDFSNVGFTHIWNITPSVAETVVDLLVRSFPLRIHAVHIVNQPMIFQAVYALFKPLLDKHMQERIHFHGTNMSSLHRHVSPKKLPKCYGGVHEEFSYRLWIDNIEKNATVVDALQRLGYLIDEPEGQITK